MTTVYRNAVRNSEEGGTSAGDVMSVLDSPVADSLWYDRYQTAWVSDLHRELRILNRYKTRCAWCTSNC